MKFRYSYTEAAESLGISKNKIYRRIREGRLRPIYDGSQPFLTHEELLRYAATAQPNLEPYEKADTNAIREAVNPLQRRGGPGRARKDASVAD